MLLDRRTEGNPYDISRELWTWGESIVLNEVIGLYTAKAEKHCPAPENANPPKLPSARHRRSPLSSSSGLFHPRCRDKRSDGPVQQRGAALRNG